jgi:hypothetical protein
MTAAPDPIAGLDRVGALDLEQFTDPAVRQVLRLLLNVIEDLQRQNVELRAELQRQRDEINRLKGEQGKPDITGNTPPPAPPTDYSSERERRKPAKWVKGRRNDRLTIHREQRLSVDRTALPADAVFKGYQDVIVQDLVFQVETTRYRRERWYLPAEHRVVVAPLPPGNDGQFGPGVRSFVLALGYGAQVSEAGIHGLLRDVGVDISTGQVAHFLIHDQDRWHAEASALTEAGLAGCPWQLLDDTTTRVGGQNHCCQVLTSPLATSYRTTVGKDRLTVFDVLRNGRPRTFLLNAEAERRLALVALSARTRRGLDQLPRDTVLDAATLDELLHTHLPTLGSQQQKWIEEALARAAYHAEGGHPVIPLLVTDDAPQFDDVTEEHALCWVHEGRHYKKLCPYLPQFRATLDGFLTQFWDYYHELGAYRQTPTPAERERLAAAFDPLFATVTGYRALDERIALTREKKAALLQVLAHPEIPLHTNDCELCARRRVRKRDVSFGPRGPAGARAWDTFQTLVATAAQYGVSFYAYLRDRLTETNALPSLLECSVARARTLPLGTSWATT